MIGSLKFLLFITFLGAVKSEILSTSDIESCKDLCSSCEGTSTFDNGICECRIEDNDERGAECVKHIKKRQIENLSLHTSDQANGNRDARCSLLGSRKRLESGDVDRVANYFINGGPLTGTPLLGNSNCVSSREQKIETTKPIDTVENQPEQVAARKIDLPLGKSLVKSPLLRKNVETVAAREEKSPIVSRPRLLGLQPHIFPSLLGAVPRLLLGIPQTLANAAFPGMMGQHHSPYLGVPQHSQLVGRSQYPSVPIYAPINNHESMVGAPQNQLVEPHLGIPNALLAGATIPSYYPGLVGAAPYSPALGAQSRVPNVDNVVTNYGTGIPQTKMFDEAQSQSSNAKYLGAQNSQDPAMFHEALVQQNSILEALRQQLENYNPQLAVPNYQYTPMPYSMVGAPNPTAQCNCNERTSSMLEAQNPIVSPTSDQFTESPTNSKVNSNKIEETTNDEKITGSARQTVTENNDCNWRCMPKNLAKSQREASLNKKKRGNGKFINKRDTIDSETETP